MTTTPINPETENEDLDLPEAFLSILNNEAQALQSEIEQGLAPAVAHARALLWLDALTKLHAQALEEAINDNDAPQVSAWTRDLTSLEFALGLLLNIQPLVSNDDQ